MARLLYGLGPDDRTATSSGATVPNAQVTVWDALTGGTQVTDITAAGVGSVSGGVVTTDAYGRVGFYGPDGAVGPLFLEGSGGGPRVRVSPSPADVAAAADLSGNASLRATFLTPPSDAALSMTALPSFLWNKVEVNGVAFNRNNVVTVGATQYAVWWDSKQRPIIGKRTLPDGKWSTYDLTLISGNPLFSPVPRDGHNNLALGVDADGRLHVAGNLHDAALRYVRSTNPGDITAWTAPGMVGTDENSVTYPQFVKLPNGTLLFFYRNGSAGNGDHFINRYDTGADTWSRVARVLQGTGFTPTESPYINQPAVSEDGTLHLFAVWRQGTLLTGTHDICHAKSTDGGVTWTSANGAALTLPLRPPGSTGGAGSIMPVAVPVTAGTVGLINQTGAAVDSEGRPHAAWWLHVEGDNTTWRLHHIWWDGATWRNDIEHTITGVTAGLDARSIARPAVLCTSDRTLILWRDNFHEPQTVYCQDVSPAPKTRLPRFPLAHLDLGGWEPSFDYDAARDGWLHSLLTPLYRDPDQVAGDENWSGQWGAVLSVNLSQLPQIAAGQVAVPALEFPRMNAAPASSSTTARADGNGRVPLVEVGTDLTVARVVGAASAATSPASVQLVQRAMNQGYGIPVGLLTVPNGPQSGRKTPWLPVRPDIEDVSMGAQILPRHAAGADGSFNAPSLGVETARVMVGPKPVAYTAPRGGAADKWGHLAAHWKFSALGLADGALIASVPDSSGNGRDLALYASGYEPTYRPAGMGSGGCAEFNGTDALRSIADFTLGNTYTIVTAALATGTPADEQQIVAQDDANGVRGFQFRYNNPASTIGVLAFQNDGGNRQANSATLTASTAHVLTMKRTFSTYGTFLEVWVDGVLSGSNYTAGNYGRDTPARVFVGARYSGGAVIEPLIGKVGDLMLFDSWLNEAEQRAAEASLARLYGVTLP